MPRHAILSMLEGTAGSLLHAYSRVNNIDHCCWHRVCWRLMLLLTIIVSITDDDAGLVRCVKDHVTRLLSRGSFTNQRSFSTWPTPSTFCSSWITSIAKRGTPSSWSPRDVNNEARYSHHMVVLSEGRVFTAGPPGEIVTGEVFREVFSVEAEILPDPRLGVPLCIS